MDPQHLQFLLRNHPWRELPRAKPTDATYIITGPIRARWLHVAAPKQPRDQPKGQQPAQAVPGMAPGVQLNPATGQPQQEAKPLFYEGTFLIPGETDISALLGVYNRMMAERFGGPDFRNLLVKNVPLPNGQYIQASAITGGVKQQLEMVNKIGPDGKPAPVEGFEQAGWFFTASNMKQPPIVGSQNDPTTGKLRPIAPDSPEVYSGGWFIATLRPYTRPKPGKPLDNPGMSFNLEALQKIADDTPFKSAGNPTQHFNEVQSFGGAPAGVPAGLGTPAAPGMPAGFGAAPALPAGFGAPAAPGMPQQMPQQMPGQAPRLPNGF